MLNATAASILTPPATSMHMTPEELARLDTSINNYLNTYTVPSLSHINYSEQLNGSNKNTNSNIGGGLTAGRLMSSSVQQHNPTVPMTPYSVAALSTRPFPPTPPQTSPAAADIKPTNTNTAATNPYNTTMKPSSNTNKLYEERIEVMKRNEQERIRLLEQEHRQHIERLSSELEKYKLKADQLAGEKMACQREIERLSTQLESARLHTVTANTANTANNVTTNNTVKLDSIKQQYEQRIADLLATFEKERQASNKLLQNKVRSQLALLLPKLKQRYQARLTRHLDQLRAEHARHLDQLRLEHANQRRLLQQQAREDAELEFKQWQVRAKEKMRVRVMQVRNEAERRVLERLQ